MEQKDYDQKNVLYFISIESFWNLMAHQSLNICFEITALSFHFSHTEHLCIHTHTKYIHQIWIWSFVKIYFVDFLRYCRDLHVHAMKNGFEFEIRGKFCV